MSKTTIRNMEQPSTEEIKNFYYKIAKNVARIRKSQNISQLELSLALGYQSVSLVAGAEAGYNKTHFNLEHLYKISKILKVEITEFFV
ncbi:helix-turn-helix transcriptional regulator [Helicobacter sp. MIT 05-5294]|uniref:helix-turn-helix domain-containing protein n=1 Tax=Helicobacter sp. MIT 05-5294 TaxID=1548150 RepID=UPI001EE808EB|nr:helix-turn-helix transcriptional regulator [Helicobacter sp. MIT 05-5294]